MGRKFESMWGDEEEDRNRDFVMSPLMSISFVGLEDKYTPARIKHVSPPEIHACLLLRVSAAGLADALFVGEESVDEDTNPRKTLVGCDLFPGPRRRLIRLEYNP